MKNLLILFALLMVSNLTIAQEKLYLVFEFMKVDNEQEMEYNATEEFWEKIQVQRIKAGDIMGWDLWALSPEGEQQGFQYVTVTVFNDPVKMMDGSSWSQLLDRAKAAYPKMAEADINKKIQHSSATRDLAVRILRKKLPRPKEILICLWVPWPR